MAPNDWSTASGAKSPWCRHGLEATLVGVTPQDAQHVSRSVEALHVDTLGQPTKQWTAGAAPEFQDRTLYVAERVAIDDLVGPRLVDRQPRVVRVGDDTRHTPR